MPPGSHSCLDRQNSALVVVREPDHPPSNSCSADCKLRVPRRKTKPLSVCPIYLLAKWDAADNSSTYIHPVVMRIKSVNIYQALKLVPGFVLQEGENLKGREKRGRREEQREEGRKERNVPLKVTCARNSPLSCCC